MDQSQINRKHMFDTTLSFLDANAVSWQSIAKIGEVKNQLTALVDDIENLAKQQADANVAPGKTKAALKHTIANKADIVNDLVEVYALITGNTELQQQMGDSASDLYKMKNDDFIRRVGLIIEKATAHADNLKAEYGFTDAQLADLQEGLDQFLEINGQPRMYRVKSAVATQGLEGLFTEANNVLTNKLDNLMKIFKRSNPGLYAGYEKARMVVNY